MNLVSSENESVITITIVDQVFKKLQHTILELDVDKTEVAPLFQKYISVPEDGI